MFVASCFAQSTFYVAEPGRTRKHNNTWATTENCRLSFLKRHVPRCLQNYKVCKQLLGNIVRRNLELWKTKRKIGNELIVTCYALLLGKIWKRLNAALQWCPWFIASRVIDFQKNEVFDLCRKVLEGPTLPHFSINQSDKQFTVAHWNMRQRTKFWRCEFFMHHHHRTVESARTQF